MGSKLFLKRNFDMFLEYILKFLKLDRAITTGTRLPKKPKKDVDDDNNNNNNNQQQLTTIELVPELDSESEDT